MSISSVSNSRKGESSSRDLLPKPAPGHRIDIARSRRIVNKWMNLLVERNYPIGDFLSVILSDYPEEKLVQAFKGAGLTLARLNALRHLLSYYSPQSQLSLMREPGASQNADGSYIIPTLTLGAAIKGAIATVNAARNNTSNTIANNQLTAVYLSNCMNFSVHVLSAIGKSAKYIAGFQNYNWFADADAFQKNPATGQRVDKLERLGPSYTNDFKNAFVDGRDILNQLLVSNRNRLHDLAPNSAAFTREGALQYYPHITGLMAGEQAQQLAKWVNDLGYVLETALEKSPGHVVLDLITTALRKTQHYDTPHPFSDGRLEEPDAMIDLRSFVCQLEKECTGKNFLGIRKLLAIIETVKKLTCGVTAVAANGVMPEAVEPKPLLSFLDNKENLSCGLFFPRPISIKDIDLSRLRQEDHYVAQFGAHKNITIAKHKKAVTNAIQSALVATDGKPGGPRPYLWDWRVLPFYFPQLEAGKNLDKDSKVRKDFDDAVAQILELEGWARFVKCYNNLRYPAASVKEAEDIGFITTTSRPLGSVVSVLKKRP